MRISDWSSDVCSSDLIWTATRPVAFAPSATVAIPTRPGDGPRSSRSRRCGSIVFRADGSKLDGLRMPLLHLRAELFVEDGGDAAQQEPAARPHFDACAVDGDDPAMLQARHGGEFLAQYPARQPVPPAPESEGGPTANKGE